MYPRMIMRRLAPLLLPLVLMGCGPPSADLEFEDTRVRDLIPGKDSTAGYFTVHNHGAAAVILVGTASPAAEVVEMHVTEPEGDVMRMRRLDEVVVGPGETVVFEPGGRHLMLSGVLSLENGIDIVFERADGASEVVHFHTLGLGEK